MFESKRIGAMVFVFFGVIFSLNDGSAAGTPTATVHLQATPPTAATVPPERTVPRVTAAKKATAKKVVRKTATTVKKAKPASTKVTSTKVGSSTTTPSGGTTTTVLKAIRATVNGSGTFVAVRAEPDPKSTLLRRVPDGTVVSISCQVLGVTVSDPDVGRTTPVWNQLTTGGYMTNMYTTLYVEGESKPAAGRTCGGTPSTSGTGATETNDTGGVTTTTPAGGSSGVAPAKPVITAVS